MSLPHPNPHVVFALTGDVSRNSRGLRQLDSLYRLGCEVTVVGLGVENQEKARLPRQHWINVQRPPGSGPRFFRALHHLLKHQLADIEAEIYHASDLYVLPAMASLARTYSARLVFDSRELYTHVASTAGRPWVRLFWWLVQKRHIQRADQVFTVSPSIAERLARDYHIDPPPVIYNIPKRQSDERTDLLRRELGIQKERVIVLHQGSIQKDRGCDTLVRAFAQIRNAALVFLGGGPEKETIRTLVESLDLSDTVYFLDAVPPDELLAYTASADIGVTLLHDSCLNHRFALPNKLFEYISAGIPVLGADLPEISHVIHTLDVGQTAPSNNLEGLARSLQNMIDDQSARERWRMNTERLPETFSFEEASHRFEQAYRKLLPTYR